MFVNTFDDDDDDDGEDDDDRRGSNLSYTSENVNSLARVLVLSLALILLLSVVEFF